MLPPGVTLREAPFQLFDFIRQALVFIGFQDLPEDERPDKKIWHDPDKLKEHFELVEQTREEKFNTNKEPIEDPVENAAAKGLIVGSG